jgi:RND superfamily putative drug exporter
MSHLLYRLGRFAARRPLVAIGAWLVVAVAVVVTSATVGRTLEDSTEVPGLDSQRAVDLLSAAESADAGLTAQVVITPVDDGVTFFESPEARGELTSIQRQLAALPNVLGTGDPAGALDLGTTAAIDTGTVSPDGRVALVRVQYPVVDDLDTTDLDRLRAVVERSTSTVRVEAGGDLFFAFEEPETGIGEVLGLLAAVVILLLAFGSVIAMGLPIGMALLGLGLGVSSLALITYVIEIPAFAPVMASMVGLGVGIDYALFVVTRHREHLALGMTVEEAAGRAVATAGQSVVFAGGTVVVSILGLAVAGIPFITAIGVAISVVVLIMVAASITLLPAFLGLAGGWIDRLALPSFRRRSARGRAPALGGWERWGAHVASHATGYALGVTAVLLAMTAPVLALRLGVPDDGTLPDSRTQRRAYDLVGDSFGPGTNGPLVIAIDISRDATVVDDLATAIAADPGIAATAPPTVDTDSGVAVIVATPATAPQDRATRATVERLRSDVFPAVLDGSPATAHVGGQTASFADLSDRVQDRLPLFIVAVVLLSFVLLMIVFRSILVPLKAALLNLLSIGAAYGVLVMVFQWEWGASLIGLEAAVPIVSFIPMLMFAIVFGMSMDYEVFLLSRVREHYLATGDNHAAVVHGLASTARVITSAALIMVSVFLGFVLGDDPTVKMLGLGLATAIFIDATVVRMILVPAYMELMGDANWWLPRWLDRLLPTIDIDGDTSRSGRPGYAVPFGPDRSGAEATRAADEHLAPTGELESV